jgi:hypothetical protein
VWQRICHILEPILKSHSVRVSIAIGTLQGAVPAKIIITGGNIDHLAPACLRYGGKGSHPRPFFSKSKT